MNWLFQRWYRRQRRLDVEILWPACVRQAATLEDARMAFLLHAVHDKAWLVLGADGIYEEIDKLDSE